MGVQVLSYVVPGWGVGELYFEAERLLYHELPSARDTRAEAKGHPLAERMRRYFAGDPVSFEDVEVDLSWGTEFQIALAEALRAVPYGETVTYGELAALAGRPNAQRANGDLVWDDVVARGTSHADRERDRSTSRDHRSSWNQVELRVRGLVMQHDPGTDWTGATDVRVAELNTGASVGTGHDGRRQ